MNIYLSENIDIDSFCEYNSFEDKGDYYIRNAPAPLTEYVIIYKRTRYVINDGYTYYVTNLINDGIFVIEQ